MTWIAAEWAETRSNPIDYRATAASMGSRDYWQEDRVEIDSVGDSEFFDLQLSPDDSFEDDAWKNPRFDPLFD